MYGLESWSRTEKLEYTLQYICKQLSAHNTVDFLTTSYLKQRPLGKNRPTFLNTKILRRNGLDILCGDLHLRYRDRRLPGIWRALEKWESCPSPGDESLTENLNILGGLLKTLKKWHKTVSPGEDLYLSKGELMKLCVQIWPQSIYSTTHCVHLSVNHTFLVVKLLYNYKCPSVCPSTTFRGKRDFLSQYLR